ncbi:MAG: hypothetical protein ABEJ59_06530 [Halanaeroarchaeum sp.]
MVQDITDRVERGQRLETAEARYRSLLEAAPDPVDHPGPCSQCGGALRNRRRPFE